uniref:transposase domain-containing protein n=1 Tax=Algoriphagus locisalis TaxID=305507 RepID=UPI000B871B17
MSNALLVIRHPDIRDRSCKIEEVNPQQWLKHVFYNIMDTNIQKIHELLPINYKLSLVKTLE